MNKIITFIIIVAGLGLLWSISGFFSLGTKSKIANTPLNYQKAIKAQGGDECQAPEGYTEEEWLEHMSHHPDKYAECLNQPSDAE